MPANNVNDLNFGIGTIEFGRYVSGVFTAYRNVGFVKGAVTLTVTQEVATFSAGRPQQIQKQEVRQQGATVRIGLAELNLANIRDALGGGILTDSISPVFLDGTAQAPLGDLTDSITTVVTADTFSFGGNCTLGEVAIRFVQKKECETGKRRILEIWRGQPAGTLAIEFSESDFAINQVEFTVLADLTRAAGEQLFKFYFER